MAARGEQRRQLGPQALFAATTAVSFSRNFWPTPRPAALIPAVGDRVAPVTVLVKSVATSEKTPSPPAFSPIASGVRLFCTTLL